MASPDPYSGRPDVPLLAGWDETPGAHGCTLVAARARSAARATLRLPIVKVFNPVFPPDENADNPLRWLQNR
ncbi:MAG TPA: hypothetical protein VGK79_13640 [Gaiellaceae bacterium]